MVDNITDIPFHRLHSHHLHKNNNGIRKQNKGPLHYKQCTKIRTQTRWVYKARKITQTRWVYKAKNKKKKVPLHI